MAEQITAQQFAAADGVEGWSAAEDEATAKFATGTFAKGVEFVDEIGRVADALNHHPDVDLRYPSVTVRLTTHDVGGLSDLDVQLARQISEAARTLDVSAATDS